MCGRYVLPDEEAIVELWKLVLGSGLRSILPRYNVAPTTPVPILIRGASGTLEARIARWGLIPEWWTKDAPPALAFNARAEEAAAKPLWRDSLKTRRCLLPARGWYEWNAAQPLEGRKGNQPCFLHCPNAPVFAFAGLWSPRGTGGAGEPAASCAVLTGPAAPAVAAIHPRMPAVLKPEQEAAWLDPAAPPEEVRRILGGVRRDLAAHPVDPRVGSLRHDDPGLMEPVVRRATGSLFPTDPPE